MHEARAQGNLLLPKNVGYMNIIIIIIIILFFFWRGGGQNFCKHIYIYIDSNSISVEIQEAIVESFSSEREHEP